MSCRTGERRTMFCLKECFWWPDMQKEVAKYVAACSVCSHIRTTSESKTVVLIVVDQFSKMVTFIPVSKLPSTKEMAGVMLNYVFQVYGFWLPS